MTEAVEEDDMEPIEERYAAGCAWIEGDYVPIHEARIPILDTGFVRSDLTYDVAAVWKGRFFRLDDHLDRLLRGCDRLRLAPPVPTERMREIMVETVRRSGLQDAYVEIVVTRGVPAAGQRDPRLLTPRLYAYAIPYVWIVTPELQADGGADVVIAAQTQRISPRAVDPTVKNFHWGDLVRGLFEAYDRGASLVLLTDGDGLVTEGPGFNVFAVVDGVLVTPRDGVLEGITRRTALEIAEASGIPVRVGDVSVADLARAGELFLTSTAGGIMPVRSLDGRHLGTGPVTRSIHDAYWALHSDPRFSFEVPYSRPATV